MLKNKKKETYNISKTLDNQAAKNAEVIGYRGTRLSPRVWFGEFSELTIECALDFIPNRNLSKNTYEIAGCKVAIQSDGFIWVDKNENYNAYKGINSVISILFAQERKKSLTIYK